MKHENYRCGDCGGHRFLVDTGCFGGPAASVECLDCRHGVVGDSVTAAFEAISKEKPCPSSPAS